MIAAGGESSNGRRAGAFLLSRPDFEVRILDIPRIPEKELEGLVRYRLRCLYPGNPRETVFDYRIESDGRRRQAVVFITRQAVLQECRISAGGAPLLLPYSLIRKTGRAEKDCRIWFCQPEWAELSIFRAGLLVSCMVRSWARGASFDFHQAEEQVPPEGRGLAVLVIAPAEDLLRITAAETSAEDRDVRFLDLDRLAAVHRRVDGLFGERKRSRSVLSPAARLIGLSMIVCLLAVLLLFKQVRQLESENAILRRTHSLLEAKSRAALAMRKSVDELSAVISRIEEKRPRDSYRLLSALARVLGRGVQIQNLQIQGDTFRIEAAGFNALRMMDGFRDNPWFGDVRLSAVVPDGRSGRERFSLSGVSHVR
ncbi:MAG: PilN domain-containing protein [Spirochaetia bacterium]